MKQAILIVEPGHRLVIPALQRTLEQGDVELHVIECSFGDMFQLELTLTEPEQMNPTRSE